MESFSVVSRNEAVFLVNIDDEISNNLFYSLKKQLIFSLKILLQKPITTYRIYRKIMAIKKPYKICKALLLSLKIVVRKKLRLLLYLA